MTSTWSTPERPVVAEERLDQRRAVPRRRDNDEHPAPPLALRIGTHDARRAWTRVFMRGSGGSNSTSPTDSGDHSGESL